MVITIAECLQNILTVILKHIKEMKPEDSKNQVIGNVRLSNLPNQHMNYR